MSCVVLLLLAFVVAALFLATFVGATVAAVRTRKNWPYPLLAVLCISAGAYSCGLRQDRLLKDLGTLQPYDANDPAQSSYFYVVAFTGNKPQLIPLRELDQKFQKRGIDSFYIDASRVEYVKQTLKESARGGVLAEIKLQQNDPKQRRQRISLHVRSDEFEYFSLYDAWDDHINPIQYADITKRDMAQSGFPGLIWFLAGGITAVILNVTCIWRQRAQSLKEQPTKTTV